MNIQMVSRHTGLTDHTLRYYEKIGLLLNIGRDSKGYRDYSEKDLVWIAFIKRLKATDMPLKEMKRFARLRAKGDGTIGERLEILETHRKRVERRMDELMVHQEKIKEKIALCRQGGVLKGPEKNPLT